MHLFYSSTFGLNVSYFTPEKTKHVLNACGHVCHYNACFCYPLNTHVSGFTWPLHRNVRHCEGLSMVLLQPKDPWNFETICIELGITFSFWDSIAS